MFEFKITIIGGPWGLATLHRVLIFAKIHRFATLKIGDQDVEGIGFAIPADLVLL